MCAFRREAGRVAGTQDDGDIRTNRQDGAGERRTVHLRHGHVGDHNGECLRLDAEKFERFDAIGADGHPVTQACEHLFPDGHQLGFIVHQQDRFAVRMVEQLCYIEDYRGQVERAEAVEAIDEIIDATDVIMVARGDLDEHGIPHNKELPIGMMVEVPAAVIVLDRFIKEIDFISIGTNDLIQYTLAVDRGNKDVASLYNASEPAVLRLLDATIETARTLRPGGWVCTVTDSAEIIRRREILSGYFPETVAIELAMANFLQPRSIK